MKDEKYKITHIDGEPVSKKNIYFVLKLTNGSYEYVVDTIDNTHIRASRLALKTYAENIKNELPELSKDIYDKLEQIIKVEDLQKKVVLLQEHLAKEEAKLILQNE